MNFREQMEREFSNDSAVKDILSVNPFDHARNLIAEIEMRATPQEKEAALIVIKALSMVVALKKTPEARDSALKSATEAFNGWTYHVLSPGKWLEAA